MNMAVKNVLVLLATIAVPGFSIHSQAYAQECPLVERQSSPYLAAYRVGDQVVVSVSGARLMAGTDTRAVLKEGESLEVRDISGPWLGSEVVRDGQKITGWVWYNHVALTDERSGTAVDRTATQPQVERRSFSYEPLERRSFSYQPSYQGSPRSRAETGRRKAAWQYPKTDPRRYRP